MSGGDDMSSEFGRHSEDRPNLIIVDDDKSLVLGIQRRLSGWINVLPAVSGESALMLLNDIQHVSMLATDLRMPGMNGLALLGEAKERYPETQRFLFTGFPDLTDIQHAIDEIGVAAVIFKPFSALEFLEYVRLLHPEDPCQSPTMS
jgi:response regulator RpfG family c-di-GMP phosphodiesterase